MKRILLAHPRLSSPLGGAEGVAAWLIHGLLRRPEYRLDIACATPPAFEALDEFFGTRLAPGCGALSIHLLPASLQRLMRSARALGLRAAALEISLLERWTSTIVERQGPYDLYISTRNELQFPSGPALFYVHYPRHHPLRGEAEMHWYHRIPGSLALYRTFCRTLHHAPAGGSSGTVAVANSQWTAARYAQLHGRPAAVVSPPVASAPGAVVPWEERANLLVILGRISPEKRHDAAIAILARARRQVGDTLAPTVHVIGAWGEYASYNRRVQRLFDENAAWLRHSPYLPRAAVDRELANARYGLHRMHDEHFGMAVAEMQSSGCVAFVHASGGPREIIGEEPRQIYATDDEAVDKLAHVLTDPAGQRALHERALERRPLFSTHRFVEGMLSNVEELLRGTP